MVDCQPLGKLIKDTGYQLRIKIVPALSDNYMHLFWSFPMHCFPEKKLKTNEESIQKTHSQLAFPRQAFYREFHSKLCDNSSLQNPLEMVATWYFFLWKLIFSRGFRHVRWAFQLWPRYLVINPKTKEAVAWWNKRELGKTSINTNTHKQRNFGEVSGLFTVNFSSWVCVFHFWILFFGANKSSWNFVCFSMFLPCFIYGFLSFQHIFSEPRVLGVLFYRRRWRWILWKVPRSCNSVAPWRSLS